MSGPALLLGIDEAGYGPRLGPLTIGAVTLCGPPALLDVAPASAWALLQGGVVEPAGDDGARVVVADSKALHRPARGIGPLEEQALAVVHAFSGRTPATLGALLALLGATDATDQPWAADAASPLPRVADPARVAARGDRLRTAARAAGVALEQIRVRAVHPVEFNAGVRRHDNKAVALFHFVAPLLEGVWNGPTAGGRLAVLDKEGARDRYLPLVAAAWRDVRVRRRLVEGRARSHYEIERRGVQATMLIEAGGERHLAVAMASMVAKYVRELAMEAWNAFWIRAVPGLRPTAGYPQDATRFLAEVDGARQALGIRTQEMARCR